MASSYQPTAANAITGRRQRPQTLTTVRMADGAGQCIGRIGSRCAGQFEQPDEILDACQSCAAAVKELLNQPRETASEVKRGAGRPRKTA